MNARLFELMCEANCEHYCLIRISKQETQKVFETFAKMVVNECCSVVNLHEIQNNDWNDCKLSLNIKKHFGIEK